MSLKERIFQAILFECLLVLLMTIGVAWILQHNVGETGALMVVISLLALLWNILFNWLFDKKFTAPRETRGLAIRCLHAVLFEGGLLLATVPLMMWWLRVDFWQAVVMDVGMTVFVLIYTVIFHWCYDHVRQYFQAA